MTQSIGRPVPDCHERRDAARRRRAAIQDAAAARPTGVTVPNGEETAYAAHALSYHKGLPHDELGRVHLPSYRAMVRSVTQHEDGAVETLPVGANRAGDGGAEDPPRWTQVPLSGNRTWRKLTSPMTGHVYEVQGADAGLFGIAPAPRLETDELAAEMAELYAMALLRDVPFTDIVDGTGPGVQDLVDDLRAMPWFDPALPEDRRPRFPVADRRHYEGRRRITTGADLFRGSTPGSQTGPWLSQFLLVGSDNTGFTFPGAPANTDEPSFPGLRANLGVEDGFILYGTQVIDQRSIVAREGIDYVTTWAAWLDCQNGVDFNDLDHFRRRRRYLTTPRDLATYVHYDALYQAYLNACFVMLAAGSRFPKDPGLPETSSRTRAAFASFGGPAVLTFVTEVATRALKAVWRHKWMHHRRARPEVVAALLTLHANDDPQGTLIGDERLSRSLQALLDALPADLLASIADHNADQNARTDHPTHQASTPAGLPPIAPEKNYLLPLAFPEGSPTHPAYGAGHATVAGACVTALKAMFRTLEPDGTPTPWPLDTVFVPREKENEGGELVPVSPALAPGDDGWPTIEGELDKLAANISIARNMAGVHYFTDYHESVRLGERITTSILEEQLSMYGEPVQVAFTSFDGDRVDVVADGATAHVRVTRRDGSPESSDDWYARYSS